MYLLLIRCILLFLHPFYVSMTEIHYAPKEKTVEISVRLFTDDIENALRNQHPDRKIDILHPANPAEMNEILNKYIHSRLQVRLENRFRPMYFIGYEQQNESIWCYFEIRQVNSVKNIQVFNTLLYDYQQQQINMIRIEANGKEKSTKLEYPANTARFEL